MAPWHTVQQGDDALSITIKYGFHHWHVIYNRPENAEFRQKRPDPNVLYPGDRIFVPNKELKQAPSQTGRRHTFRLPSQTALLRIVLEDDQGQPYAGKKYTLRVGKKTYQATTGGNGLIEHDVPLDAEEGELTAWLEEPSGESHTWKLKIRHLDPVEEMSGVQARLNNLGFDCGPVDNALNDKTRLALKAFQTQVGIPPTGALDKATRQKLMEMHDTLR